MKYNTVIVGKMRSGKTTSKSDLMELARQAADTSQDPLTTIEQCTEIPARGPFYLDQLNNQIDE